MVQDSDSPLVWVCPHALGGGGTTSTHCSVLGVYQRLAHALGGLPQRLVPLGLGVSTRPWGVYQHALLGLGGLPSTVFRLALVLAVSTHFGPGVHTPLGVYQHLVQAGPHQACATGALLAPR